MDTVDSMSACLVIACIKASTDHCNFLSVSISEGKLQMIHRLAAYLFFVVTKSIIEKKKKVGKRTNEHKQLLLYHYHRRERSIPSVGDYYQALQLGKGSREWQTLM